MFKLKQEEQIKARLVVTPNHDKDSGNRRKREAQEKKKPLLLKQLENQLQKLDEISDHDLMDNQELYIHDNILDRLNMIAKEANKLQLNEIEKLCKLAIGKRILNIELKKRKDEHNKKLMKKQKIQLFFRENRIKKFDYESLISEKLQDSTLVIKAYDNGKGFVESDKRYRDEHEKALIQCDYIHSIKEVNKIFYKNYAGLGNRQQKHIEWLLKFIWIPIIIFICLGVTIPFVSFQYEEIILMIVISLILVILMYISIKTFYDKPNNNNHIQQSICDVKEYFEDINQNYYKRGVNVQWRCSNDFMYLEVIFHNGFP